MTFAAYSEPKDTEPLDVTEEFEALATIRESVEPAIEDHTHDSEHSERCIVCGKPASIEFISTFYCRECYSKPPIELLRIVRDRKGTVTCNNKLQQPATLLF